jgi:hypothetical protein
LVFAKENLLAYLRNEKLKGRKIKKIIYIYIKKWGWFFAKENCFWHTCTIKKPKGKKIHIRKWLVFCQRKLFWHNYTMKKPKWKST